GPDAPDRLDAAHTPELHVDEGHARQVALGRLERLERGERDDGRQVLLPLDGERERLGERTMVVRHEHADARSRQRWHWPYAGISSAHLSRRRGGSMSCR